MASLIWRKSSYSTTACVEVASTDTEVAVRNSRRRGAERVTVGRREFARFVAAVNAGRFQ